jgi:hypothetical protein
MQTPPIEPSPREPLDQVSDAIRTKHYSYRTEQTCKDWIKRYILFHDERHPKDMGADEVEAPLWQRRLRLMECMRLRVKLPGSHVLRRGGLAVISPLD